jgi:SAM-dependent methyltransferase
LSDPVGAPCPVCGTRAEQLWATAHDVEYETTPETFSYWLCEPCDVLVIDPVPSDRLSEIYPPTYYSSAGGEHAIARNRNFVTRTKARLDRRGFRRILREVRAGEPRLLDVGGGTGDIAAGLVEASGERARATVVDFDADTAAVARARGLEAVACRFEDFDTEERFDVVLMLNLIEHVDDPVAVMRKGAELVAPGGVVWIQTPNWRSLDARLFRKRDWAGLHCPRHWVLFSRLGLERALGRAGLAPRRIDYTQAGAFWAASALACLRTRQPGRRGPPLVQDRLFLPLAAAGAAFDFATLRLRATSQQVCVATPV